MGAHPSSQEAPREAVAKAAAEKAKAAKATKMAALAHAVNPACAAGVTVAACGALGYYYSQSNADDGVEIVAKLSDDKYGCFLKGDKGRGRLVQQEKKFCYSSLQEQDPVEEMEIKWESNGKITKTKWPNPEWYCLAADAEVAEDTQVIDTVLSKVGLDKSNTVVTPRTKHDLYIPKLSISDQISAQASVSVGPHGSPRSGKLHNVLLNVQSFF